MKISERKVSDVTVLDLSGKITIGLGDVAVRDAVQTALAAGARKILLNMEEVSTIDSAGVGELVAAFTRVTNRGGQMRLVKLPPKVNDILQITQLITVFEIFDTEDEGMEAFAAEG